MKICIVIPVYKATLNSTEYLSLKQCVSVLGDFDIYFCEPKSLHTGNIRSINNNIQVEKFDDIYFKDVLGYNKLMLSHVFYSRFKDYDYMLLYQLDAYVFKNELNKWCEKKYDYIGAPWLASKPNLIKKMKSNFSSDLKRERESIFFKVGNGGLSLRKVATFLEITSNKKDIIQAELQRSINDYRLMEDVFWSVTVPALIPDFKIPEYKEAVYFAIDRRPKIGFKLTNNTLPFGCHGFNKPNVVNFWKKKIEELVV